MQTIADDQIIALYFRRDQQAIAHTEKKYGGLCQSIAKCILGNREDAEECVNDALFKLWEAIPPAKPQNLAAFLTVTVRNMACNRRASKKAAKRGGGEVAVALSEIEEVLASKDNPEAELDARAVSDELNSFLGDLPAETRVMFVLRYWSNLSIKDIADKCGVSQSKVKMTLLRTRNHLKDHLEKEGLL